MVPALKEVILHVKDVQVPNPFYANCYEITKLDAPINAITTDYRKTLIDNLSEVPSPGTDEVIKIIVSVNSTKEYIAEYKYEYGENTYQSTCSLKDTNGNFSENYFKIESGPNHSFYIVTGIGKPFTGSIKVKHLSVNGQKYNLLYQ